MVFLGELGELGVLGSAERRNLIRETLPRAFEEKLSVGEAFNAYKNAGLGIRRSDFNSLYWENAPRYIASQRIAGFSGDKDITPELLPQSNYNLGADYRYIGRVVVIDPVTDELRDIEYGIDTDFIGTKQDIQDYFYNKFTTDSPEIGLYSVEVIIDRAYRTK